MSERSPSEESLAVDKARDIFPREHWFAGESDLYELHLKNAAAWLLSECAEAREQGRKEEREAVVRWLCKLTKGFTSGLLIAEQIEEGVHLEGEDGER